jgi:hypothetical protein
MNSRMLAWVAAGAALSMAGPARADQGGPSLAQIYDVGRCIVVNDRGAAVALLRSLPVEEGEADLSRLSDRAQRCARGMATVNALHLRGAIAQALFFRDFGGFGEEPRRSTPLVNLNLPVQSSPPGTGMTELYRWADCVVRNDNAHAERLLSSTVGSRNEATAIASLRAFMSACAPAGQQLAVRPSDFRSLIAQSAYQSMYRYWTRELDPVNDQ